MKRHPRSMIVADAEAEFSKAFLAIEEKYNLTFGEMFHMLGERIARLARDNIQTERHPDDPKKSGDVA